MASNLTQEELADRADLAKSFISQLERDQSSLSVDSLLQILKVLNVKVTDFFRESSPEKVVYTPEERSPELDMGVEKFQLLIPGGTNRKMEGALVRIEPEQKTYPIKPFQGEALGYVLQGILTISFGSEIHAARVGDSFYFSGEREHVLENTGRRSVEFIWVTIPPIF